MLKLMEDSGLATTVDELSDTLGVMVTWECVTRRTSPWQQNERGELERVGIGGISSALASASFVLESIFLIRFPIE